MNYINTLNLVKKVSITVLSMLAITTVFEKQAEAVVVTFDDIETTYGFGAVESGYGGLDWVNFGYVNQIFHPGSGYENGLASGDYTAFNWYAKPAEVTGDLFDFQSTFLTAAWNNGLNILVEGFSGGILKYSQNVVVNPSQSKKFIFDYIGVDRVKFTSSGGVDANPNDNIVGRNFVMDNFTYHKSNSSITPATPPPVLQPGGNVAEVPEPISVLGSLVALGFGGIFYRQHSRKSL
ncbi:PEP-CTERM sorting domain-containing protein [Mastigocoleus testarum]|uniref:PEP-CTERM protein-sorting domain-containing protein n=1 Tax=Mastigocoleus testarum BC008 TaxID=371196 RepID=A0A0V7ZGU4_9CYAN|nr:PEP-CTERM sorting domain-containing protein [Mastigocoleus testarum]KST63564.1 hypothetical protein BC008_13960 [Mastigocoleus testarum BC008]KST64138.1 hypothetical protein BC008_15960 [Mastigocoleus testarum BC008]